MKKQTLTDEQLIASFLYGNKTAASHLFKRYSKHTNGIMQNKNVSQTDREDLCLEILEKVFLKLTSYDVNKGKFKSWFSIIASNTITDYHRRKNKLPSVLSLNNNNQFIDYEKSSLTCWDTDKKIISDENTNCLNLAINQLSTSNQQLAILLLQEKSNEEIATILNISLNNLAVQKNRMFKKLKEILTQNNYY